MQQAAREVDVADTRSVIECEAAGHDADDGVEDMVELKRATDDMGIAVEVALPEFVVQHDHVLAASLRIGRLDAAAKQSVHTKECVGVLGEIGADEVLGNRAAGDFHVGSRKAKQVFNTAGLAQGFELRFHRRKPGWQIGMLFVDEDGIHDAVGIGVGEGVQKHGVDEREHRRRGADAECEREHGDGGEAGIAAQGAETVADIAAKFVKETEADGGTVCLVLCGGLPQIDAGFARCFFGRESLADEIFAIGFKVGTELFFYIARRTRHDRLPEPANPAFEAHISSPFASRMPATTEAMSVQRAVSCLSWRLPAAVSE